ncbi:MAG: Tol-Pal system beta propeller repeat protein TolB [Gallionella sp.]|nr:Tol-Pal system beta propeller repeat protein TolB [Gallionella sp.]
MLLRMLLSVVMLLQAGMAAAVLDIEIIGAGENQIPISIAPFGGDPALAREINEVVRGDLMRCGLFRLIDASDEQANTPAAVSYPRWRERGADALGLGKINRLPTGRVEAQFFLLDIVKQRQAIAEVSTVNAGQARALGHHIADLIYENLTGSKGIFGSRFAYINRLGSNFRLLVADSDGYNEQVVLARSSPMMSPAWSPDGSHLAYVSFENGHAAVYVQSLLTQQRVLVANFPGSNSAPAWSPDGRQLAVVLTRDHGSQIYTMRPDGSGIQRISFSDAIDTEPNFSPDGQSLIFTSDRGGSAQIYQMSAQGGTATRLTFGEGANFSPRYSPDGKSFVFTHRVNGKFYITTQDFQTGQMTILTEGGWEKKPSFAPNGKLILFASEGRGRGILATVSSDGRVKQQMFTQSGDAREPVWETRR